MSTAPILTARGGLPSALFPQPPPGKASSSSTFGRRRGGGGWFVAAPPAGGRAATTHVAALVALGDPLPRPVVPARHDAVDGLGSQLGAWGSRARRPQRTEV